MHCKEHRPTKYEEYEQKCSQKTLEELRRELKHQEHVIIGNAAGAGLSTLSIPLTLGLSAVAVGGSAALIHVAKKKRAIVETELYAREAALTVPGPVFVGSELSNTRSARSFSSSASSSSVQLPSYDTPASLSSSSRSLNDKEVYVPDSRLDHQPPPSYDDATAHVTDASMRSERHVHFSAAPPTIKWE